MYTHINVSAVVNFTKVWFTHRTATLIIQKGFVHDKIQLSDVRIVAVSDCCFEDFFFFLRHLVRSHDANIAAH